MIENERQCVEEQDKRVTIDAQKCHHVRTQNMNRGTETKERHRGGAARENGKPGEMMLWNLQG